MPHSSRRSARRSPAWFVAVVALFVVAAGRLPAQKAAAPAKDYTPADVTFMQGMIIHHAQAVVMSEWAPTRGAEPRVATICARIANSQRDEISLMQHWLEDRHLAAPDPLHMRPGGKLPVVDRSSMHMPGMDMGDHPMMMSGMLSPAEMHQLEASHGVEFDRLFLTGMIKHHQGAIDMVATLFSTPGGGQQPDLFLFATDIDAGQRAEMARMQSVLKTIPSTKR